MAVFFEEKEPAVVFAGCCKKRKVKIPNKAIVRELKKYSGVKDVEELDLSTNYVGTKQLMAIADFMKECECLDSLVASGLCCYHADLGGLWHGTKEGEVPTGNEAWAYLLETIKTHPSITSLDISNNDCGPLVGRLLEDAVKSNGNILDLKHENVLIDRETLDAVEGLVRRNVAEFWRAEKNGNMSDNDSDEGASFAQKAPEDDPFGNGAGYCFSFGAPNEEESKSPYVKGREAVQVVLSRRRSQRRADTTKTGRRVSRSCAPFNEEEVKTFTPPVHEKDPRTAAYLTELLKANLLFTHLHDAEMKVVVAALFKNEYEEGEVIMKQDDEGDNMYTIAKGSVDIIVNGTKVAERGEGVAFGELALMYNTPRTATVKATTRVVTWGIDQDTYRNIVMSVSIKRRNEYQEVLSKISFLSPLQQYEILQLADALETQEWESGDFILRYGDEGEYMYIILSGEVEVIGRDGSRKVKVCRWGQGSHFGELEFLNNHKAVADVVAVAPTLTARLNSRHFELCLGPIEEKLRKNVDTEAYSYYRQAGKVN
ncbi:cAMP-dependent protein kinase regulatory subunit [Diplonema papillatum]|nr:cAMP-dependent protein kinase regulatory subunit [Diplonema papillatum]